MKFKVQAGAELDIPSTDEIKGIVDRSNQTHWEQYTTGLLSRSVSGNPLTIAAGGTAVVAGPDPGWIWEVRRISVFGAPVDIHFNDSNPSTYIDSCIVGVNTFGSKAVIVKSGSVLIAVNNGMSTVTVNVNLGISEVPVDQEWKL